MSANKEATSSSSSEDACAEKSVDKLSVRSSRTFLHPKWRAIQRWAPVPPPVLFKEFLHFTQIPSLHPPQYSPGADGMQHSQPAVQPRPLAVEVLFVYSLRRDPRDMCWSGVPGRATSIRRGLFPKRSLVLPVWTRGVA
ncbi:hypothetical protein CK203_006619 [Vitis vinifera]|uniref:Uncharacterized protein n=1 Tax=Vitis vinifera TaxID=29760 RepID=A0A438KBJ4_VITVI|nr:hypothetical protein CK203_006619 [Vitis vinifera]